SICLVTPIVEINFLPNDWSPNITNKLIVCGSFIWTPKRLNLQRLLSSKSLSELEEKGMELMIIGRAKNKEIVKGNKIKGVFVSGEVKSVEPFYKEAALAIVPELAGGGFKLKIAEAVQHNLPIVAIKGAVTDLEMKDGIHYIEVDSYEDLITEAIDLLNDKEKVKKLVNNANLLFKSKYSLKENSNRIQKIIK
ncbi:glycosyltransferase family 4 protein, partial [Bacteroides caecigallinarum]|uniref:glycosyltransferase family 4 protein n=1 Tax=Bacteroides caecigallinarum TaxID=1411144 RepID=UPI001F2101B3